MLKEYHKLVDHLSWEERVALRGEWEKKMENILDDEAVTLSPAVHLKRAEKYMLDAVHNLFVFLHVKTKRLLSTVHGGHRTGPIHPCCCGLHQHKQRPTVKGSE